MRAPGALIGLQTGLFEVRLAKRKDYTRRPP